MLVKYKKKKKIEFLASLQRIMGHKTHTVKPSASNHPDCKAKVVAYERSDLA